VDALLNLLAKRKKLLDEGHEVKAVDARARLRARCWLILLLIRVPALKQHRSAILVAKREEKEATDATMQPTDAGEWVRTAMEPPQPHWLMIWLGLSNHRGPGPVLAIETE